MTIRTKLFSIGFIVVFGFLSATYLLYTGFNQIMNLKSIELKGIQIETIQNDLSLKSIEFISEKNLIESTYSNWSDNYNNFNTRLNSFTSDPELNQLGGAVSGTLDQIDEKWSTIFNDYYKPINILLNILINDQDLKAIDSNQSSIIDIYEKLRSGEIKNDKLEQQFAELEKNMQLIDSAMSDINGLFNKAIDETNDAINGFIIANRVRTIQMLSLIVLFIVVISTLFSRQTTKNIKKMEKYIASLANGDFSAELDIRSRDEFGNLTKHFSIFTDTLWEKLNSLRDVMRDIGNSITVDLDQQSFIDNLVELAIDSSKAEAGILLTVEEESKKLVVSNISGFFPPPFQVSKKVSARKDSLTAFFKSQIFDMGEGIIGETAQSGKPVFIHDTFDDDRLPFNKIPEDELYISSIIFIPLIIGNRLLGVLGVCKTKEREYFSDLDFSFLRSYGEYSAMALDNLNKYRELLSRHELMRELNVASDIQKNLLPEKLPVMKSAVIHAYSEAAKGISGDYYDAFEMAENKVLITVCDVAGKGVPASLVMIMIRTILRLITAQTNNARSVVTLLNNLLTERLGIDHFATIGLFIYDTKRNVISYTNGAHHPLYVYKADSERFLKFDTDGLPLGLEANTNFGHKRFRVSTGDYLVLFTDGLNEARNISGEEFTTNRLLSLIKKYSSLSPEEMTAEIRNSLAAFTKGTEQHDDQTLLLMKVN